MHGLAQTYDDCLMNTQMLSPGQLRAQGPCMMLLACFGGGRELVVCLSLRGLGVGVGLCTCNGSLRYGAADALL